MLQVPIIFNFGVSDLPLCYCNITKQKTAVILPKAQVGDLHLINKKIKNKGGGGGGGERKKEKETHTG